MYRKLCDNLANVVDETHVEHPVGFIEHQMFDITKSKRIAPDQIEQPPRRSDQHIDAVKQGTHLCAHRHAADGKRCVDTYVAAVGSEAIKDLAGQLARGAKHQDATGLAFWPASVGEEV